MNKLFEITTKIVVGVCIYGVYRKTYDWGRDYIDKDINAIRNFGKEIINSVKETKSLKRA